MPNLAADVTHYDSDSEGGEIPFNVIEDDAGAKEQLNGELSDQVPEVEEKSAQKDNSKAKSKTKAVSLEEDEEIGSEDGEVYTVEAILSHKWRSGELLYEIKWVGYDKDENTFEPERNLLPDAAEILSAYHIKEGGVPQPPKSPKKRKSTQSLKDAQVDESIPPTKKSRRADSSLSVSQEDTGYRPKGQDWEPELEIVETVERDSKSNKLMAYLRFKNGKKAKVGMEMVYKHCPVPMLKFYETHLKFT